METETDLPRRGQSRSSFTRLVSTLSTRWIAGDDLYDLYYKVETKLKFKITGTKSVRGEALSGTKN